MLLLLKFTDFLKSEFLFSSKRTVPCRDPVLLLAFVEDSSVQFIDLPQKFGQSDGDLGLIVSKLAFNA